MVSCIVLFCRSENVKVDIIVFKLRNNQNIYTIKIGESRFNNYDSKVVGKS